MPAYNENGDYVLEDGTVIPSRFAQAAGFGMELQAPQPVIDPLTLPNPQPAPPHLAGMGMAPQAPPLSPEFVRPEPPPGLAFQEQVAPQQVEPVAAPVAQPTDGLPALEQAPYDDRVQRTTDMYGSHPGRQQLRAEYTESGADLLQNSADGKYESDTARLTAEAEGYGKAAEMASAGAEFSGEVARDLDARQQDIRNRSAQLREELDNFEMDPDRVFRNRSTWGGIADAIAVGLGALAQYSTGRNVALDLIRKRIDDDMFAQKTRRDQLQNQYNRIPDEIQSVRQYFDNEVAADSLERAQKLQVVQNEMQKKLTEVAGRPAAEAAYQQGLAQVIQWKNENLDRAEKAALTAEAQAVQLQVASMKKQGGGGASARGTLKANPKQVSPPTGAFLRVTPDGKQERVFFDMSEWSDNDKVKWAQKSAAVQTAGDAVATINKLPLDTKVMADDEKADAVQQIYTLINDAVSAEAGTQTEGDVSRQVYRIMGATEGDPTSLRNVLKDPKGVKRRLSSFVEQKRKSVSYILNQYRTDGDHAAGAEYVWGNYQDKADPRTTAAANDRSKTDDDRKADANDVRQQVRVDVLNQDPAAIVKLGDYGGMSKDERSVAAAADLKALREGRAGPEALLKEGFPELPKNRFPTEEDFAKMGGAGAQREARDLARLIKTYYRKEAEINLTLQKPAPAKTTSSRSVAPPSPDTKGY